MYANSEDKQDKNHNTGELHPFINKARANIDEMGDFCFWAPVWNLLFLPGSTKPLVSNFCIYALRICMLWGLTMDSVSFLKQHVQQKVIGIFSNLPSLIRHSSHLELFVFPACCKQEGMTPLTGGFEVAFPLCNWIRWPSIIMNGGLLEDTGFLAPPAVLSLPLRSIVVLSAAGPHEAPKSHCNRAII